MMLPTRSGRRASQRADELLPFIALLRDRGVRSYLEIGARHGDTFFEVMRALSAGSRGVAVDLAGGPWGTPKSVAALKEAAAELRTLGYDIRLVFGDSGDAETIRSVRDCGAFDAVLIDGDHRYAGVAADWRNYGGMAPIVAFHDIAGDGQATRDGRALPVEVPRLWREIRELHASHAFIGFGSTMGIGVIFPGSADVPSASWKHDAEDKEADGTSAHPGNQE